MAELAHMNRRATAGELSASIAHELNQPLGAILSNTETAEMLLGSPSPNLEEIKEILADIKRDDQRAEEVIVRLRRLLQKAPLESRAVDINQIIREVFNFLSVQARAAGVTLDMDLDSKPLAVRGDPIQLQQVVLNLVMNGIEAVTSTSKGKRQIIGQTRRPDRSSVEVAIADSGAGIPPEKLEHVFDPFFTTKGDGMGMGLSIARTIVEAHGGRIWAANQSGGAVFRVSLPFAEVGPR
jgi:C4-dicarboxylate-specific signal transduction histidine kinase